jgi:phage/plasmid-like protein (TIGR03299 family)
LHAARGARKINPNGEFSRYEVVRVPRPHKEETEALLGVVSRRYQPLQNAEAFQFFDAIVGEQKAYFETAGALGEGERIWVLARMPDAMEIVRGDECYKYLLLSNRHDGTGSVAVKFTSIRVVCQNTLMLALEDGKKAYRVRHSRLMQFRLDELAGFLSLTQEVFQAAAELFKRFARIQMTNGRLNQYLEAVFPRTEKQKKAGEQPVRWAFLQELFDSQPDLQLDRVRGTLWAAYNTITRFEDYKQPQQEEQPDQRLERVWFGSGANTKLLALQKAQELSATWSN